MRKIAYLLVGLTTLLAATLACSFNFLPLRTSVRVDKLETGPTVSEEVEIPVPDSDVETSLEILMGAGELYVRPGAVNALLQGTVSYNVEEFAPHIITENGYIQLRQGEEESGEYTFPDISGDVENTWDLQLGGEAMELIFTVGASRSDIELGGLAISDLRVTQGASDFELSFSEPNQVEMSALRFTGGASDAELNELANANARDLFFTGGAGRYKLDFRGDLQDDMYVKIEAGLGEVIIIVPEGTAARAEFEGALADVDAYDDWRRSGDTYTLEGTGARITFEISMGLGSLELRNW
jgi:hypothetical protein